MAKYLCPLALSASINIVDNVLSDAGPVEVLAEGKECLCHTGMSGSRMVVTGLEDPEFDVVVIRDVDPVLVQEKILTKDVTPILCVSSRNSWMTGSAN